MNRRLLAIALLWTAPAAAEASGALRLWVGSGLDSNARRDFTSPSTEVRPEADGVVSAIGSGEGRVQGEASQLNGALDLGVRKFLQLPSEDVFISSGAVDGSVALGRYFGLGLGGRAKDRRGGDRDYSDLTGEAFLELVPDRSLQLRLRGGGHRFLYWNRIEYSFAATELGALCRYRFDRRHGVFLFGDLGLRRYQGLTNQDPELEDPPPRVQRKDLALSAGAGYSYRGPFTLAVTYSYSEQQSNSFGESSWRHRLSVTGGFRLPARLTLLGQLGLQLSRLDRVYLSPELVIAEDDESHNSVSLKLVRPVSESLDAELKLATYQNWLPRNDLEYRRLVGWLGLTWRL